MGVCECACVLVGVYVSCGGCACIWILHLCMYVHVCMHVRTYIRTYLCSYVRICFTVTCEFVQLRT